MHKLFALTFVFCLLSSAPAGAARSSLTGLETESYKAVGVLVEEVSKDAIALGLTSERIRTRVELRLRSAGLKPTDALGLDSYLYVRVRIVGLAFSTLLDFCRLVTYESGTETFRVPGACTWRQDVTGTHGNDASYVINYLDQTLDMFLNEYLKANQK